MQYFIEIFTPTKFHEILHHYVEDVVGSPCVVESLACVEYSSPRPICVVYCSNWLCIDSRVSLHLYRFLRYWLCID